LVHHAPRRPPADDHARLTLRRLAPAPARLAEVIIVLLLDHVLPLAAIDAATPQPPDATPDGPPPGGCLFVRRVTRRRPGRRPKPPPAPRNPAAARPAPPITAPFRTH